MQEESRENKNAKRLNFLKGRQSRNPSQTNGGAKIQINSETAIPKLQNLAQKYIGATNPQGFLTDLRVALGIPDSQGASKYGVVTIPKDDGSILQASLRITNHQANAEQYIQHNANYEYNLSIVVKRKPRKNTFIPNDSVKLDEYVYYGTKMQEVENPLTQVVKGIISFLQSGEYKDTTGIAFKNQSPQPNTENKQNLNCNTNMKKKVIRLTESDLHNIVKESVQRVLMAEQGYFANEEPNYVENPYRNDKSFCEWFEKLTFKPQGYEEWNKLSRQQWAKLYKQYQDDIEQDRTNDEFRNGKNPTIIRKSDGTKVHYPDVNTKQRGYIQRKNYGGWEPYNQ